MALASKPNEMRLCLINLDPLFDSIQDCAPMLRGTAPVHSVPGDGVGNTIALLADLYS